MNQHITTVLSASALLAAVSSSAQSTVVSDSTFAPSNWSQIIALDSVPGSTAGFSQVLSGGDPGSYLAANYAVPSPGRFSMMTFYSAESYSPLVQGPIQSISFSASLQNLRGFNILFFGVLQNNTMYYRIPPPFFTLDSTWMNVTSSPTSSSDFAEPGFQTQPNFINGGPIQFGVVYSAQGGIFPGSFGLDNFRAEIVPVPEPTTLALTIVGGIALFSYARRKTGSSGSRVGRLKG